MLRKRTVYDVFLVVLIIIVLAVNFLVASYYTSLVELTLSLSIASAISIGVQIISALRNMPELEIRYVFRKDHELYALYHLKDTPLRGDIMSKEEGNYLLIGLANIGSSTAKNCRAILWIFDGSDFSKPLDNPFPLYWSYDPNSRTLDTKLPEYYSVAPGDEGFLFICYSIKSSSKFYFLDYGQRVSLRRQRITPEILHRKLVLYVKVIAYCDNGDPTQKFFKVSKKNYESLTMEEIRSVKST